MIATLVDNHPYYAQQLAQLSWLRTKDVCTVEIVREAHTALVEQLSLLFVTITETLTTQQLNYLKALIAGEKAINSTEVMHRYQISSTTSISRSKAALIKNDILDNKAGEISFQDPIYAYWLKTEYFCKIIEIIIFLDMSQKIEITNNWNIQRVFNELENGNIKIPRFQRGVCMGTFQDC